MAQSASVSPERTVSDPFVRYHSQDRIAWLTLNRPASRNAIASQDDCEQIIAAVERAQADAAISCLILGGAGSAFCAGGDLKAMQSGSGIGRLDTPIATRHNYRRGIQAVIRSLWDCELPMIAAVNGPAIGLGCDLACTCDLRIAADSARFASSFINIGLIPGDGGAWLLPRSVGLANAAELILTGETIDAVRAREIGLVSRVVAPAQLADEARALAEKIVSRPAQTLRLAKRLLREGQQQRLGDLLELSAAYQALAHESDDHREALAAFRDKREPHFSGN